MGLRDGLRELLDRAEHGPVRWFLVVLGVMILLRLKMVIFAAALPVMAYWHYSNQEEPAEVEPDTCGNADADARGPLPWPTEDEDDDLDADADFRADSVDCATSLKLGGEDIDPYEQSFWMPADATEAPRKAAPWNRASRHDPPKDTGTAASRLRDDDLSLEDLGVEPAEPPIPKSKMMSWETDNDLGNSLDLHFPSSNGRGGGRASGPSGEGRGLGAAGARAGELDLPDAFGDFGTSALGLDSVAGRGPGSSGMGLTDDFDFLGGAGDDMDFFGSGSLMGGRGKGKGKGKSKGGEKGGLRDSAVPREPNPKQVFVANVGDMLEEDIRAFFEDVGEVDRLKVLRHPDGASKGVCFVTFRTEEQAQKALQLHGSSLQGKNLVVRLAHGGTKGAEKGSEKGGKGFSQDRFGGANEGPPDLGGSERFGAAFGLDRDRDRGDRGERGGFSRGRGGKGAGAGRRTDLIDICDVLEEALAEADGPLKAADFDFAARRFLAELRSRDRVDGTTRLREALDMVLKYTNSKDRSSVRKWPAYIFTLLQKFDPNLWEELRERDAERKREKGGGGFGVGR